MGCVASKLEEEDDVVSLCRERKRLLKSTVERRYALADAHCRYSNSLYAVAAAIRLFVARHSSPSSPYLITFPPCPASPPSENVISNPMFLQQRPSESTQEAVAFQSSDTSSISLDSSEEERERVERKEEQVCGESSMEYSNRYFYTGMPSPQRDFGWDFFNPFDGVRTEVISGFNLSSDEDLRVVREEEGIPELEEEVERERGEEKVMMVVEDYNEEHGVNGVAGFGNLSPREQKGLTVMDTPTRGRELLEALKDVEDHFIRAYDSGKDVSRMLEANRVLLQSGLEEIKDNSTKLIQAITWHRSTSSQSSSCKSFLASSSKSSTWKEFKNDIFDDYGGMESGSHSLTLGRLYAWEKKLYEEVKAGDCTRKIYERKCSQLRNKDAKGDDLGSMDKTRVAVKDLYTSILVAIRRAETISEKIQKLRDEELQPQLVELLQGLMKTWKIMLESHETQNHILFEVKYFTCPAYGKFCNDSHRLATLQLEAELQNWRACFIGYLTAQKAYVEALNGWLSKFIVPEVELYSRGRSSVPPYRVSGPPLLLICHEWLTSVEKLPDKAVAYAMKNFGKDVRALWTQQGHEQQQKRKVDGLAKELDRRVLAFQRAENRILETKLLEHKSEAGVERGVVYLTERKELLDMLRKRLDSEKEKHHNCMQETQRITLSGFQIGFFSVFDSLTEFSKASLKMYDDLVTYSEKAKADEKAGNPSYTVGAQGEVECG
ncbi:hypothetical protein HHK36_010360 [Tetracentron sinense]|uniref:DUF632 domain-containing protein n=1 Tax=Tetracentron sinense TaxID=13715 RepID=A0A835DMJ4_TETSI|nr:hypothetical protein HHK36_010360 [Tetracentron sinense]